MLLLPRNAYIRISRTSSRACQRDVLSHPAQAAVSCNCSQKASSHSVLLRTPALKAPLQKEHPACLFAPHASHGCSRNPHFATRYLLYTEYKYKLKLVTSQVYWQQNRVRISPGGDGNLRHENENLPGHEGYCRPKIRTGLRHPFSRKTSEPKHAREKGVAQNNSCAPYSCAIDPADTRSMYAEGPGLLVQNQAGANKHTHPHTIAKVQ